MSEQIFISYRRTGGDITAKLICESLKNRGYSVFYDYDSLSGGYFDERILDAIRNCNDFIAVLPANSLDRCVNEDDWVRQEIALALQLNKNIIPVMLPDFTFPKELPPDIEDISRINAVQFYMAYFDGVVDAIVNRLISKSGAGFTVVSNISTESENLAFTYDSELNGYEVSLGNCTDTDIVIPKSYQGKAVVAVAENAFRECSALTSVFLPDTIRTIKKSAFYKCALLKSINIPEHTGNIGDWAFYECESITSVAIPKTVKKIGLRSFTDCFSVQHFDVDEGNLYYRSVENNLFTKDMRNLVAYAAGQKETSYSVPDGVVTISDSAFSTSMYLENVILPESVDEIEKFAFIGCKALKSITMPAALSSLGNFAFKNCSALTNITVPQNIREIGEDTFRNCSSLKEIILPDSLKIIGESVFDGCCSFEKISIPQNVTAIGKWCFYGCSSLTSISLSANIENIGARAFARCMSLQYFEVDKDNIYYRNVGSNLFTKNMKTFVAYAIGQNEKVYSVPYGVTAISDCAFSHAVSLETIILPDSLDEIKDFAFNNCSALKNLVFPKTADYIGENACLNCTSLTSVTIPKGIKMLNTKTFKNCSSLRKAVLPDTLISIGESAFSGCSSMEEITIPKSTTEVKKWAFNECASLESIKIPKNVKNISPRVFRDCSSLKSISVSLMNRNYRAVDNVLFTKDMKTLVAFPMGQKSDMYIIPDSVTRLEDSSFYHSSVKNITIPSSIESMGEFALCNSDKLKSITYEGAVEMWNKIIKEKQCLHKISVKEVTCTDGKVKI